MKITKDRFNEMIKDMEFLGTFKHFGFWDSDDGYIEGVEYATYIKNHSYNVYCGVYYELDERIEDSQYGEKYIEKREYIFYDVTSGKSVISELLKTNEAGDRSVVISKDGKSIIRDYIGRQGNESIMREEFIIDPIYVRKMKLAQLNQIAIRNKNETDTAL